MRFKIIIIAAIVTVIAGGMGGYFYWQKLKEAKFLSANPQTKDAYAIIARREAQIKKDKSNYDVWMSLGFNWKGIGEITKNDEYLKRSIAAYNQVIKRWGNAAYLPFVNRANVFIDLKDYARAEEDLKVALEIGPGEQNLYVNLAELYKNYMNKDSETIKAVYEKGIKTVVGGGNLVVSYASYLEGIGDYKNALKYYKMLQQAFPANAAYGQEVKSLESKTAGAVL